MKMLRRSFLGRIVAGLAALCVAPRKPDPTVYSYNGQLMRIAVYYDSKGCLIWSLNGEQQSRQLYHSVRDDKVTVYLKQDGIPKMFCLSKEETLVGWGRNIEV